MSLILELTQANQPFRQGAPAGRQEGETVTRNKERARQPSEGVEPGTGPVLLLLLPSITFDFLFYVL